MRIAGQDPSFFSSPSASDVRAEKAAVAARWVGKLTDEQIAAIGKIPVASLVTLNNDGIQDLAEWMYAAAMDHARTDADPDGVIDSAVMKRVEAAVQL